MFCFSRSRDSHLFYFSFCCLPHMFKCLYHWYTIQILEIKWGKENTADTNIYLCILVFFLFAHATHTHTFWFGSNCIRASFHFFVNTLMRWIEGISCKMENANFLRLLAVVVIFGMRKRWSQMAKILHVHREIDGDGRVKSTFLLVVCIPFFSV